MNPYIPADTKYNDFSIRAVIAGVIFGALFGTANAYLGLRVGLTISTSIPLAVIMVALFKALKPILGPSNILEWNIGQTAGSASSSIASGIIFTIPALFMWNLAPIASKGIIQFGLLAMSGGVLGILFMIPLRSFLIVKEHAYLPYPEGTASAQVLMAAESGGSRAKNVFLGIGIGILYKALMSLAKLWPSSISLKLPVLPKGELGMEPTPALLGVGYILGYRISAIMVAGGLLSWLCLIPMIAYFGDGLTQHLFPQPLPSPKGPFLISQMSAEQIWSNYVRYIGAGAVAMAGIMAVFKSLPIMYASLKAGLQGFRQRAENTTGTVRTKRDLPMQVVMIGVIVIIVMLVALPFLFGIGGNFGVRLVAAICVAIFAFLFVTVSSRIVGLVGVTSNPTSGMAIVTLLGTAGLFYALGWTDDFGKAAVLTIGTVVCVAASIAGDISQDLKTGYIIGATPAKQQTSELIGAICSAFAIAAAVYLLGSEYGFGTKEFPAPQATLMKTVIEGVLAANLPWGMVLAGASLAVVAQLLGLPALAFAVGIYLPLSTMTPVFVGGVLKATLDWFYKNKKQSDQLQETKQQQGVLLSSGLIAGEGLMGVGIALYAFIYGTRPQGFQLPWNSTMSQIISLCAFLGLTGVIIYLIEKSSRSERT